MAFLCIFTILQRASINTRGKGAAIFIGLVCTYLSTILIKTDMQVTFLTVWKRLFRMPKRCTD